MESFPHGPLISVPPKNWNIVLQDPSLSVTITKNNEKPSADFLKTLISDNFATPLLFLLRLPPPSLSHLSWPYISCTPPSNPPFITLVCKLLNSDFYFDYISLRFTNALPLLSLNADSEDIGHGLRLDNSEAEIGHGLRLDDRSSDK